MLRNIFSASSASVLLLLLFHHDAVVFAQVAPPTKSGGFVFVQGALGSVQGVSSLVDNSDADLAATLAPVALSRLSNILQQRLGATGRETLKPSKHKNRAVKDPHNNHLHLRYEQTYQGLEVVDAALVMHLNEQGNVYAVNGEFVAEGTVEMDEKITCRRAFHGFLDRTSEYGTDAVWMSNCVAKIVLDRTGTPHKAWQRMIGYTPKTGPYQKTNLYASVVTGELVAVRPTIKGAVSLETRDCNRKWDTSNCEVVSRSSQEINTNDESINDAHNFAIATYNFYKRLGRDSIDDEGMTLISNVHFGKNYANAYWDGSSMTYGDGDGVIASSLARAADVVGHELTHGVTERTSNLVYQDESGALNEAISDIFGACVDRQEGASQENTWKLGEAVWTPGKKGDALRYMNDPQRARDEDPTTFDADYYPDRYRGYDDSGGVHWNSGIANLGGTHPRSKSTTVVPAIDSADFDASLFAAAQIFYLANTACLTPMSGFYEARLCTVLHAGDYTANVEAAWDAVGVNPVVIANGVALSGLSGDKGDVLDFLFLSLPTSYMLSCTLSGSNGDADLYMQSVAADYFYDITYCESKGYGSEEACTVGPTDHVSRVTISIKAYKSFTDATLTCTQEKASSWVTLQNGVPATGLQAKLGDVVNYILTDIEPLQSVTCTIKVTDTTPTVVDVALVYDSNGYVYSYEYIGDYEYKGGVASIVWDTPRGDVTNLRFSFSAYEEDFDGVTLTCTASPVTVAAVTTWKTYTEKDLKIQGDSVTRYFQLDDVLEVDDRLSCLVRSSDNLYMSVEVYFGDAANVDEEPELACTSYDFASYYYNYAECLSKRATSQTGAYAVVSASESYYNSSDSNNVHIVCGKEPPVVDLVNNVAWTNQKGFAGSDSALNVYRLKDVRRGERVTCETKGLNGNADLYVRQGDRGHPLSSVNDCSDTNKGTSNGKCSVPFVYDDASVYVTVHAAKSYSNLDVKCSRDDSGCQNPGKKCSNVYDCCGSMYTCDGEQSFQKICKKVKKAGGKCVRSTQCALGSKCKSGRCRSSF